MTLAEGTPASKAFGQSGLPLEVGCCNGGVASSVAREDPAQVMWHSEERKAGYLDLGVLMLAADDGGERACGRGVRIWWQGGNGRGWRDGLLQLRLILQLLFQPGQSGQ